MQYVVFSYNCRDEAFTKPGREQGSCHSVFVGNNLRGDVGLEGTVGEARALKAQLMANTLNLIKDIPQVVLVDHLLKSTFVLQ